jgi:hypothetical protein
VITLEVTGDDNDAGYYIFGASNISMGQTERLSGDPKHYSYTFQDPILTGDYLFTGGQNITLNCFIDTNHDTILGDGDYYAEIPAYTVNGNATVSLRF